MSARGRPFLLFTYLPGPVYVYTQAWVPRCEEERSVSMYVCTYDLGSERVSDWGVLVCLSDE